MREDPDNHRRLFDGGDDPELAATLRAVFEVDIENALEPFVGDRGARDVPAQAFEFLALIGATAHSGMQAEAVRFGAQGSRGFLVPAGHGGHRTAKKLAVLTPGV